MSYPIENTNIPTINFTPPTNEGTLSVTVTFALRGTAGDQATTVAKTFVDNLSKWRRDRYSATDIRVDEVSWEQGKRI